MDEIQQILNGFYRNVALSMLFIVLTVWLIWYLSNAIPYWKSTYFKSTNKPFSRMFFDRGSYGEYLLYKCLRGYEAKGAKFLFNCYLPKDNAETSEIDVMMVYKSGIYVFESKNYSGWIFGSESNKLWTQTLPNGRTSRKEKFYNPIMQNRTHVKWLEKQVEATDPLHCIVVFSQRCELKKLEVTSGDISVVKRDVLPQIVREIDDRVGIRLDDNRINQIYEKLYPYTQVSDSVKEEHINAIEQNYKYESEKEFDNRDSFLERVEDSIPDNVCPRCGGELILRTAKKGENAGNKFYGCSNYPKCRYVRNIEG